MCKCTKDAKIEELTKQLQLSKSRNLVLEDGLNKAQEENYNLLKLQQNTILFPVADEERVKVLLEEVRIYKERYTEILEKYRKLKQATDTHILDELNLEKSKVTLLEHKLNRLVEYNQQIIDNHVDELKNYNRKILTENSEVWYWQPEGENFINSLVCPLVINIKDLPFFIDAVLANSDKPLDEMLKTL